MSVNRSNVRQVGYKNNIGSINEVNDPIPVVCVGAIRQPLA